MSRTLSSSWSLRCVHRSIWTGTGRYPGWRAPDGVTLARCHRLQFFWRMVAGPDLSRLPGIPRLPDRVVDNADRGPGQEHVRQPDIGTGEGGAYIAGNVLRQPG